MHDTTTAIGRALMNLETLSENAEVAKISTEHADAILVAAKQAVEQAYSLGRAQAECGHQPFDTLNELVKEINLHADHWINLIVLLDGPSGRV